jgi:muramoyltetrapeptide carboxypeptidase
VTQRAGLAAFHGPMVVSAGDGAAGAADMARLLALLAGDARPRAHRGLRGLRPGRARACVTGGNLSLLAHLAGTPFQLDARGRILFVEETGEAPYRIDRMVRQLLLAGVFRGVAGVALGEFSGIRPADRRAVASLFLEALGRRAVPVVAGLRAGHGAPNRALPFGVAATLDADAGTLLFDACVAAP